MAATKVAPRNEATVMTWGFGEDPPEGLRIIAGSDGKRHAVRHDDKGQVTRNHEGHALSIPEGGAAIVHPSGRVETVPPKAHAVVNTDNEGNTSTAVEWRNNPHGVRNAVRAAGYDVEDDWDPFSGSSVEDDNDNGETE